MSVMMYLVYTSVALAVGGPAYPSMRVPRGDVRKGLSASSRRSHMGLFSQYMVAPSAYPFSISNHLPNCSLPWNHLRNSFAAVWFFEYFMRPWENATAYGGVCPSAPSGMAKCEMSRHMGSPFSSFTLSGLRLAMM